MPLESSPCAAFLPARPTPHGAHFTTSELLKRSGVFPVSKSVALRRPARCCRKRSKDRDSFHQRRHGRSDPPRMETDLTVTPEYLQTMGLVLRMGRDLLDV